jgi:hypothetical protein
MTQTTFAPGSVITNRNRLWRVDAQAGEVLVATPIDGGETEPRQFYIPLEHIRPGRLEPPSPEIVGHPFFFTPGFRLVLAPHILIAEGLDTMILEAWAEDH